MNYGSVHQRLTREHGAARNYPCAHCGRQADEWAYDHRDRLEVADLVPPAPPGFGARQSPRVYSLDPAHYLPLCRQCHRDLDAPTHCRAGHALDETNTYRSPGRPRERLCRTCRREWTRCHRQHRATTERNYR